jgi:hypothetical protein
MILHIMDSHIPEVIAELVSIEELQIKLNLFVAIMTNQHVR